MKLNMSMIGKKIIRECGVKYPNGVIDYSYSLKNPYINHLRYDEYVILKYILPGGAFVIEWHPKWFPNNITILKSFWDDGKWIVLEGV